MPEPVLRPAPVDRAARRNDPGRNLAVLVYLLHGLASFTGGLTLLAGVVINYLKMDQVRDTWVEPHFRWQIVTFWYGLLWFVVGSLLTAIFVGFFVLGGVAIWTIYRAVRGALALNDGRDP